MIAPLRIRDSIATTLLKVIFSLYLVVTIIITAVQMTSEFRHTSDLILKEIEELANSFSPGIATALWTYNTNGLNSILSGMQVNPTVIGVKIDDGSEKYAIGTVEDLQGNYTNFNPPSHNQQDNHFLSNLIGHEFPIILNNTQGEKKQLGTGTIYSSTAVVFERVKYGFYLIIFGAIIKTLILWFLFIYFIRRIVGKPLNLLAQETNRINLENLDKVNIDIKTQTKNELKQLEDAFNQMLDKLKEEHSKLDNLNQTLEQQVNERTQALKKEVDTRKNAQLEAEQANNTKTLFLNNMSHELRTPMNAIIGHSFLLGDTPLVKEQQESLTSINKSAHELLKLIDDVFDFSNMEAGTLELETQPFNIKLSTKKVIHSYTRQALQNQINLNFNIAESVPETFTGDQARIEQILDILINNALKFTKKGAINISLTLTGETTQELLFSIKDTGIGIPEEKLATIFESFTQIDGTTTRQYGGTGIGLTICKHLINLMGGRIWLESMPEQGSSFYIAIPYQIDELAKTEQIEIPDRNMLKQASVESAPVAQILMIEDDPKKRIKARNHILKLGYAVDMVASDKQAMHALKRQKYQVILISETRLEPDSLAISEYIQKHSSQDHPKLIEFHENGAASKPRKTPTNSRNSIFNDVTDEDTLQQVLDKYLAAFNDD